MCVLIFFLQSAHGEMTFQTKFHGPQGFEIQVNGMGAQPDPIFGSALVPSSIIETQKLRNGKVEFQYKSTIDQNGFRTSSAANKAGKKKHFLLIDGSFVYGENLNDSETMSHHVNVRSKIYEAYPVAYSGYGMNHSWMTFFQNKLPQKIKQKTGSAVIFTHEGDIERLFGKPNHLPYSSDSPRIIQNEDGSFKHVGNFVNGGSWLQRVIGKYCVPYRGCRDLLVHINSQPTKSEYKMAAQILEDIERMYKAQFTAEDFYVVWCGQPENRDILQTYTKIPIYLPAKYEAGIDNHPTKEGVVDLVNFYFDSKFVE